MNTNRVNTENMEVKEIKKRIKFQVEKVILQKVHFKDNGKIYTITRHDTTNGNGFGHFDDVMKHLFPVTRLDGGSFDIDVSRLNEIVWGDTYIQNWFDGFK